jgi:hypothetical protein
MPYNDLFVNADVRNRFGWKLAICQHPMYLLIDEDRGEPIVGERVAPWGAPNAEEYVGRIIRNLASLKRFPDLKISYEFSGAEVEGIAEKFPDVVREMKARYDKGQLDFVNGTFAQPHLHTVGSESNWRQFEFGLGVYKKLFGKDVKVYQEQETSVHQQLPQILKKFGYEFMVLPDFRWMLSIKDANVTVDGGACHGVSVYLDSPDNFVSAAALDGTKLPTYFNTHASDHNDITHMIQKDMLHGQKTWIMNPDMIEVNDDEYKDMTSVFKHVLLEKSLEEEYKSGAPHYEAALYSTWSYVEGVWAEELLRRNKEAEEHAVLAENLCCLAGLMGKDQNYKNDLAKIWHDILKYQHHDVSWIEVTDLRQKAVNILGQGLALSRSLAGKAAAALMLINAKGKDDASSYTLFNVLAHKRIAVAEINSPVKAGTGFQKYAGRNIGTAELGAFSAKSFSADGSASDSKAAALPGLISTPAYTVTLSPEGLIKQLNAKDRDLLKDGEYLGGELRCIADGMRHSNKNAECAYFTGPVFDVVERSHKIANIPIKETYFYFKTAPYIKVEIEFDFNGNEIGNFWADYSKINVYYPTTGNEYYHDIPFGFQKGKIGEPAYAMNWVYSGGLVYINRGNIKCWVKDGVISNMLAWGGQHFDNRQHFGWTEQSTKYDLRLYGKRKIEYWLYPAGDFDGGKISVAAEGMTFPIYAAPGKLDARFIEGLDETLMVTTLHEKDGKVYARGWKAPGLAKVPGGTQLIDFEIFDLPL